MNAHGALQLLDPLKLEPEFRLARVALLLQNAEPFAPSVGLFRQGVLEVLLDDFLQYDNGRILLRHRA